MGRWQPNGMERLQEAAMTLFHERGYTNVTIADIAERAGLTKRSFFNHFTDKREVLFAGALALEADIQRHIADADEGLAPIDLAVNALTLAGRELSRYAEFAALRREVIASAPELQERSLIKLASLSSAMRSGIEDRHVDARTAALVSEAAVTIFNMSYDAWTVDPGADFGELMQQFLSELRLAIRSETSEPRNVLAQHIADGSPATGQ